MAVQPGDYSPDNWSSGYRIKTVDSADKRAELFNDFSYWMVRKFEIEIDTRYANDMNIIKLVNDATSTISSNYSFLNARINSSNSEHGGMQSSINSLNSYTSFLNDRINSTNTGQGKLQSQVDSLDTWLNKRIDSSNSEHGGLQSQITSNYSWLNARIDSTNTGQGKLQSQVNDLDSWVNKRIDSTNTYTSFLNDRIDSTNTSQGKIQGQLNATDAYAVFLNSRIDSSNSEHVGLESKILATDTRLSSLTATVNSIDLWTPIRDFFGVNDFTNNHGGADGAFTKLMKTHNQNILNSITAVSNKIKDYTTLLTTLNLSTLANKTAIDSFSTKNAENLTFLTSAVKSNKYDDTSFKALFSENSELFKVASFDGVGVVGDGKFILLFKGSFIRLNFELNKIATAQNAKIDSLKIELTAVGNKIKDYTTLLTTLNLSTLANKTAIDNFSTKNDENLTFINATLKGLKNYDDTSLKNIISTRFSGYFNGTNYESGTFSEYDGVFTKLIKGQFTRLIAELNRQLTLSFTTTTNNIDSFKTYLREEFALLNDWASLQVDWSKMINENILVAIAALDKILAKPVGNVNVNAPAFDFERLKELLDELSFGNVVNEAGTNLWDVLKELIDALGGVVEAVVGIVPDLIDKLIGLIIPENPNFFSEDVQGLTDAFDMKFEWAFNLNSSFKSVFSQPKSLKSLTVPINGKNYKVVPDVVDLNMIKTIFTGYFCFLTLFTSYKRIVGGGDVIQ